MRRCWMTVVLVLAFGTQVQAQRMITITPVVTTPDTVVTADSVQLVMTWMARGGTDSLLAPVAMLLPMMNHDRSSWHGLDSLLADQGFAVVSMDMRGHGASAKRAGRPYKWKNFTDADFAGMAGDIGTVLSHGHTVAQRPVKKTRLDTLLARADFGRVILIGASIGSSAALVYAADHPEIAALVMLSPGLNYRGIQTEPAMRCYGNRPVYLAAGSRDEASALAVETLYALVKDSPPGVRRSAITANDRHGTDLFDVEPGIKVEIVSWLLQRLGLHVRE